MPFCKSVILLFLFEGIVFAQVPYRSNYSQAESTKIIDELTTADDAMIKRTYNEKMLLSVEWHQEWPLRYIQYYYRNGVMESDGLMDEYHNIGYWKYYDTLGNVVKYANYSNFTYEMANGQSVDPYYEKAKMMQAKADSFIVTHFGLEFVKNYKVTRVLQYYEGGSYGSQWLDPQQKAPREYSFWYNFYPDDTLEYDLLEVKIDAGGKFKEDFRGNPPCLEAGNTCHFTISKEEAIRKAQKWKFDYSDDPYFGHDENNYYWLFVGYYKGDRSEGSHREMKIDVETGKADTGTVFTWCDHCASTVYTQAVKDTLEPKPSYEKRSFLGVYLNVPNNWVQEHDYGKTSAYSNDYRFYNDTDTLYFKTVDGILAKQQKMDYVVSKDYYDTEEEYQKMLRIQEARQEREDSIRNIFRKQFPDGTVMGRPITLSMDLPTESRNDWSIGLEINDRHGGYGVYQTSYFFSATGLTEEQFYKFLEIFMTARFSGDN